MNLFHNNKLKIIHIFYVLLTVLIICCLDSSSFADKSKLINIQKCDFIKNPEDVKTILFFCDESNELFSKCDSFFIEKTRFGINTNRMAVMNLLTQYCDEYNKVNQCIETNKQKSVDDNWVDDLINTFGKEAILKYKDPLLKVIEYLYKRNETHVCKEFERDAFYSEYQFYDSFQTYLKTIIEFSNTLESTEIEKSKHDVDISKKLLSLYEVQPLSIILSGSALYTEQATVELNNQNDLPEKILEFILNNPSLSGPFNFFDACDSLNNTLGK